MSVNQVRNEIADYIAIHMNPSRSYSVREIEEYVRQIKIDKSFDSQTEIGSLKDRIADLELELYDLKFVDKS